MDFLLLWWIFGGRRKQYILETEAERKSRLERQERAWQDICSFFSSPAVKYGLMIIAMVSMWSFMGTFMQIMDACDPASRNGLTAVVCN